ncbi:MAG TPA: methylated-DNA--[protein]-cysteine S-methyltransferase [Ferrovibrio sp.]|jgi:methylated-DNA-[protein]-cysteine S-methyltransferase|uniref:methylated-DNA--[protein]-cysteine S-methyltransferase n=1 Tax=Ferrovibrio sp. TaxID=1917215 RepID=UPI002B4AECB9|nr:methylated-DNA--[protein]-cysteine S-methyltransferase [Ferrovibrio sp.]HLT76820.1 methylated-DNA--[protein]-cysteine S-methyltransferase [Ferrovibrio sp.]
MTTQILFYDEIETPIGKGLLITDVDGHLRAFDWEGYEARFLRLLRLHYGAATPVAPKPAPVAIRHALEAYFAGDLSLLGSIPCATAGTTFQRAVWAALREIPIGQTMSYAALAAKLGCPKAVRAVGLANGANPIGVVVPCHRVVGSNGSLTGYAGGLERKRWLLAHEGAALAAAA